MKHKTQGLKEKVSWLTMWESLGSGETLILDKRELETRRGFGFLQQQCNVNINSKIFISLIAHT